MITLSVDSVQPAVTYQLAADSLCPLFVDLFLVYDKGVINH